MKTVVLIIMVGIMLLAGGAAACANGEGSPTPAPESVTPDQILNTYNANPADGVVSYEGKKVRVRGAVRSFNNEDLRVAYLTPKPFRIPVVSNKYDVLYIYASKEHIATLSRGQEYEWDCIVSTHKLNLWRGKELQCKAIAIVSRG